MVETVEKSFEDFFLSAEMLKALDTVGYARPTPVQAESIPLILAGIDLIVQSQTGSGKTAAFAVPTIEMLESHPGRVEVLVLAPTRELAKQSALEFERLGQYKKLSATAIYGGASYEEQYEALKAAQIVCATPGRLLDLANRGNIDLSNLRIFCLDEADEMLSMGFREELNAIVEFLPEERQSLLFSATVNEDIKNLAKRMLYYPEYISLSGDQVAAEAVTHVYYRVRGMGRQRDLVRVIEYERPGSAIIFCNTRDDTFMVTKYLQDHGYRAKVLNGDLPQKQREATLEELRNGQVDFLVATDVAARGIDITGLSHVINFSLPSSAESYVHRTGRTGRAGKTGRAISLVAPADMATHFDIMSQYDIDITQRQLPTDDEVQALKAQERLTTLVERIEQMSDVPSERTEALADELLAAPADSTAAHPLRPLLAKLLALADLVLREEKITDIVTGRAKIPAPAAAAPAATATAAEARPALTPTPEDKPAPKPAPADKAAHTEQAGEPEADTPRSSRRRSSGRRSGKDRRDTQSARASESQPTHDAPREPKAPAAAEAPAPAAADTETPAEALPRRRRRSRNGEASTSAQPAHDERPRKASRGARTRASRASASRSTRTRGEKPQSTRSSSAGSSRSRSRSHDDTPRPQAPARPAFSTSKMYMNVGRDHLQDSSELLDLLCYMSGFDHEDFGEISLQSSYSFVQVRDDYFHDIINALNNQQWNGLNLSAEPARS